MIINAVGCPYSGTNILKILLHEFGVRTRDNGPDLIHDRRLVGRRIPYDCNEIPGWVTDWIQKYELNGLNDYMKLDEPFFHDEWGRICAMYALHKHYPQLDFLIMLRNPRQVIGQWQCFEGATGPEITAETYKKVVENIYEFMFEQADLMEKKPIVMSYDDFVMGHHNRLIFDSFEIENSLDNIHKAQKIISSNKLKECSPYTGEIEKIVFFQEKLRSL